MGVRAILLQKAVLVDAGQWETGRMTKAAFPLSKNRSLRLGNGWDWRVIRLEYASENCRILITFHRNKQNAHAYLGIEKGTDMHVICILESHSTHPGWHVHTSCDHAGGMLGRLRWPGIRRIPRKGSFHRAISGVLSKDDVLGRALEAFRALKALE